MGVTGCAFPDEQPQSSPFWLVLGTVGTVESGKELPAFHGDLAPKTARAYKVGLSVGGASVAVIGPSRRERQ